MVDAHVIILLVDHHILSILIRSSFGDAAKPFCLHSCHKPLTYAVACSMLGSDLVHTYVGREHSGRSFNELTLNDNSTAS